MPRGPRRDAPGVVHHVLVRGIERGDIFHDDADRQDFLDRLARQIEDGAGACLAWTLMPNHVHLVLRTGALPLSRLMARLNTGYAVRFNRRHDRVGHLFQNRFKSILVPSDAYLRVLIRYVHRNPLEAGLVASLDELARFPWCGHGALMGRATRSFQAVDEVLAWFGPTRGAARVALVAWMGEREGESPPTRDAGGDPEPCTREDEGPRQPRDGEATRVASTRRAPADSDLDHVIASTCARLDTREDDVRAGRRDAASSRARAAIAYQAIVELGLPGQRVAAALGVTPGAVSRALARGRS